MHITRFTSGMEERSFELRATGERNPSSESSEIWLHGFEDIENVEMDPPGSWIVRGTATLVSTPDKQPSTLRWAGIGNETILLTAHAWSGIVELRTGGQEQRIDLYDGQAGNRLFSIAPIAPTSRFHAQVPRRQLVDVSIALDGVEALQLRRLYIGTLIPTVFDTLVGHRSHWRGPVEQWKPDIQEGVLAIGVIPALDRGGPGTFAAVASILFLLTCGGALLIWGAVLFFKAANETSATERLTLEPFRWRWWAAFAMPFALSMGIAWMIFYPGQPSLDTWYQWDQISAGTINNHHPAFHTLLIRVLRSIWDSPASSVVFQVVFLVVALASAFELLRRLRIPVWALATAYLATLLAPQTTHMAIAVVKDTPYAASILMLVVVLGTHLFSGREGTPRFWLSVGLLLGLITLFRHNGILVSLGLACLLPLFFWNERRRSSLALVSGAFTLLLAYCVLYPVLNIRPRNFSHSATSYSWHVAAFIDQDVPLTTEEADFLNHVRALDSKRWLYTPTSVAVTIWGDLPRVQFNFPFADAHILELKRLHDSLILRYPGIFVRHIARSNAYLYAPILRDDLNAVVDMEFFVDEASTQLKWMAARGHPLTPVFPRLYQDVSKTVQATLERGALRWILWMPAHFLYLAIAGVGVSIFRTRQYRLLLLLAPIILNTISLTLGVAQETRFQFPVFLSFGVLGALAALPRLPKRAEAARHTPSETDASTDSVGTPNQAVG